MNAFGRALVGIGQVHVFFYEIGPVRDTDAVGLSASMILATAAEVKSVVCGARHLFDRVHDLR